MGLGNKFEQAQAMMGSPKVFLAEVSRDGRYAGNRRIMALVRELLDGFRKFAGYAVLSGLKGLNPFRKDAEMVDAGYYDFEKTPEYKQLMGRLAAELGITEEYFQEETLKKYEALRGYIEERFDAGCEGLSEMELTGKGLFSFRAEGTSFLVDVVEEDVCKEFGEFLAESRDYRGIRLEELGGASVQGYRFMDAGSEAYKAFLAQRQTAGPGREAQKPQAGEDPGKKMKNQDGPGTGEGSQAEKAVGRTGAPEGKTADKNRPEDAGNSAGEGKVLYGEGRADSGKQMIWMDEFVFEKDGGSVILKRYRGRDIVAAVPSVIEADGKEFPVAGVWDKAFLGTPAEHVWLDAGKIRWEEWNPMAMRSRENSFLQVHWRNLSPEMERTLRENRRWAELELQHPSMFKDLMEGIDAVPESPRKKHPLFSRWREKRDAVKQAAGQKREGAGPGRDVLDRGVPDAGRQDRKISARKMKNRGMDI